MPTTIITDKSKTVTTLSSFSVKYMYISTQTTHNIKYQKIKLVITILKWYNCKKWNRNLKMSNLPTTASTEAIIIAPENLEVANCYLQTQDIRIVAEEMGLDISEVKNILDRREVKAYVDNVFLDVGFNNRFKMRSAMDAIIKKKFQDMEEAGVGSNKDIAELLALSHKMAMEYMDKQIALEKLRQGIEANQIKSQVNVQINEGLGGTKYGELITKLLETQC